MLTCFYPKYISKIMIKFFLNNQKIFEKYHILTSKYQILNSSLIKVVKCDYADLFLAPKYMKSNNQVLFKQLKNIWKILYSSIKISEIKFRLGEKNQMSLY